MTEKQFTWIKAVMGVVLLIAMLILSGRTAEYVTTGSGGVVARFDTAGARDKEGKSGQENAGEENSGRKSAEEGKSEQENLQKDITENGQKKSLWEDVGGERAQKEKAQDIGAGDGRLTVVIDAGHGGIDPGKVGINKALEKDINLIIAEKVKTYLELSDVKVIMTRESDGGLYQETDSNKKVQDMKNRVALIDSSGADLAVSIHQNSYQEEYVKGAQVFYYATSLHGQEMAEIMQSTLAEFVEPENKREAKANDSYYLLKKTKTPIIIAECGFLSNSAEAELLTTESYQDRMAWAIHMGILRYANEVDG